MWDFLYRAPFVHNLSLGVGDMGTHVLWANGTSGLGWAVSL